MMLTKVSILLLGVATVLTVIFAVPNFSSQKPFLQAGKDDDEALTAVQSYVALSSKGKFEKLTDITVARPEFYDKAMNNEKLKIAEEEQRSETPSSTGLHVAQREEIYLDVYLKWVREEFPRSIFDHKLRITNVTGVSVKGNQAKVEVQLGNNKSLHLLPWSFLLIREKQDGRWLIFEVTTPAYAQEYPFKNISQ